MTAPRYRICIRDKGELIPFYTSQPFSGQFRDVIRRCQQTCNRICTRLNHNPKEVIWELEKRKDGIDRWEIIYTSQWTTKVQHDNSRG